MLNQIIQGDCREVLKTLPDNSVNCCVTSPPYYGLRDYGTGTWEGGDADCIHSVGGQVQDNKAPNAITSGVRPGCDASTCRKCGAKRIDNQIGLEKTIGEYVRALVEIFREVKRVLRKDGTFWLNLGDSYIGYKGEKLNNTGFRGTGEYSPIPKGKPGLMPATPQSEGLGAKQLIGIPWRVAFALQEDGWILRSDIIWHKPNPMPESVTDRPTKSHEYIFLFTKSKRYFYDADAIKEPTVRPGDIQTFGGQKGRDYTPAETDPNYRNGKEQWGRTIEMGDYRNKRTVWTVATQPYKESHFATFPEKLIEPCILAGCPAGGTVLDPFGGSGTTGRVATKLGRNSILIELNPEYLKLIDQRTDKVQIKMAM